MDVRVGGAWRWIGHGPDGQDAPFKGEYLELVSPERLVQTEIFDVRGFDDRAALNTLTLEDLGGRTKLVARSRFPSVEDLEGALATGMVGGALETYDGLADSVVRSAAHSPSAERLRTIKAGRRWRSGARAQP